jgi:uncharacterized membrane protein YkvA (DUF1232 family)
MPKKNNDENEIIPGIVQKRRKKAEEYLCSPEKTRKLIDDAISKANTHQNKKGPLADVWDYLTALFRLLRAYINREYIDIPWGSIVLVVIAIIYFVSIIDLIADFIPGLGYIDDAAVITFVIAQIKTDLDKFIQWEKDTKLK